MKLVLTSLLQQGLVLSIMAGGKGSWIGALNWWDLDQLCNSGTRGHNHPQPKPLGQIFGTVPKVCQEQKTSVTPKFLLDLKDTCDALKLPRSLSLWSR